MKKRTLSLITAAALAALLMTGCAQAAAYNGRTTTAPQTGESTTTDDAVSVAPESTASAPVAAPASEPTTSIAGGADAANGYIGEDAAKAAALEHAGLAESDLQGIRAKLEYEDGRAVYDVEFVRTTDAGAEEYDYEIDATTGEILSYDYDAEYYIGTQTVEGSGTAVTADQAKQIALAHAGVAETDIRSLELETDRDNGRTVYEFSWKVGFTEYDYEIDADTGEILSYSQEQDD